MQFGVVATAQIAVEAAKQVFSDSGVSARPAGSHLTVLGPLMADVHTCGKCGSSFPDVEGFLAHRRDEEIVEKQLQQRLLATAPQVVCHSSTLNYALNPTPQPARYVSGVNSFVNCSRPGHMVACRRGCF